MSHSNTPAQRDPIKIQQIPVAVLEPDPRNARTHTKQQVRQIGASIQEFGFVNPILIDEADRIIAGHARRDAAAQLGLETVPVIRLSHLTGHQKRALAIADNKLAENAGWNEEVLALELKILSEVEVDFDVTITGFAPAEMMLVPSGVRVHIALGVTDMRKGLDGLAMLVQEVLKQYPFSGHLFAFRGRKANLIKIVFRDGTGLCLFTKRLEERCFPWPGTDEAGDTLALSSAQLSMLIEGIDWRAPERIWRPVVAG